jgi:hypothetical protein
VNCPDFGSRELLSSDIPLFVLDSATSFLRCCVYDLVEVLSDARKLVLVIIFGVGGLIVAGFWMMV